MYSVLDRVYKPGRAEKGMPDFYVDLNLNQIVKDLQDKGKEYDIRSLYYRFPEDYQTVCYRQEVYREIREKKLEETFHRFSKHMRDTRRYMELSEKSEDRQQYQMYYFNSLSEFTDGVELLREVLGKEQVVSTGLRELHTYMSGICQNKEWMECRQLMGEIRGMLSELRFVLNIDGNVLRVRQLLTERFYFENLKVLFPDKFSGRTGIHDIPEEYLIPSPFGVKEKLGYLETEIVKMYRRVKPEFFQLLTKFNKQCKNILRPEIYKIEEEVQFYLVFSAFQKDMEVHGCTFCQPKITPGGKFRVQQVYDLALARKNRWIGKEVVSNSVEYREGEKFFVVTGPNQGGKTTFARSLGQVVYFAMMGLPVPAEAAELPYIEHLLTHFSVEESMESGRGKLKEELTRLAPMMQEETKNGFVILNELFTTAATYDAFIMGQRVLTHFSRLGCIGVYVTHVSELTKAGDGVVSLVALEDEKDHRKRTFRVIRKEAEGVGFAGDIVEKHRLGYEELRRRLEEGGIA